MVTPPRVKLRWMQERQSTRNESVTDYIGKFYSLSYLIHNITSMVLLASLKYHLQFGQHITSVIIIILISYFLFGKQVLQHSQKYKKKITITATINTKYIYFINDLESSFYGLFTFYLTLNTFYSLIGLRNTRRIYGCLLLPLSWPLVF